MVDGEALYPSTILDKITFNNQLTLMRKSVCSAKKKIIRQLIRQIARLRKSSTEKNTQKINKLLEEMSQIKKLDKDEISKFAIMNQKSFAQGISNTQTCTRQRGVVRVATSKPILDLVTKFRLTYPSWERDVPLLLQILGIKRRVTRMSKEVKDEEDETRQDEKVILEPQDEGKMLEAEKKVVDLLLRQSQESSVKTPDSPAETTEKTPTIDAKKEDRIQKIETSSLDYGKLDEAIVGLRSVSTRAKKQIVKRLSNHATAVRKSLRKAGADDNRDNADLRNTIKFIKRLVPDDISKYALARNKEMQIDENSTTTQKAMESLTTAPIFTSSVNKFRSKYPNWEIEIQELLPRKYHKVKPSEEESSLYKMESQDLQETTVNSDAEGSGDESDEGSCEEQDESAAVEDRVAFSSDEEADDEELSDEELSDNHVPMEINSEESGDDDSDDEEDSDDGEDEESSVRDFSVGSNEKLSSKKPTQKVRERTSGVTVVKRLNLKDLESENISVLPRSERDESEEDEADSEAENSDASDPGFFIGYKSRAKKNTDIRYGRDIYEVDDQEDMVEMCTETTPEEYQKWAVDQLKSQIDDTGDKKKPTFKRLHVSATDFFNPEAEYSKRPVKKKAAVDYKVLDENSHIQDNYLAQQKSVLTGKPNTQTFSNRSQQFTKPNQTNNDRVKPQPSSGGSRQNKFSAIAQRVNTAAEPAAPLHPSWEAKRQQKKPAIQTFTGKKITFDD